MVFRKELGKGSEKQQLLKEGPHCFSGLKFIPLIPEPEHQV
jgi:hypothetical protein